MKVWVVFGYDLNWKEPYVEGVFAERVKAVQAYNRIRETSDFQSVFIEPMEVDE